MEKLACRSPAFLAKSIGTAVSISGAFIVTLYTGPPISVAQLSSKLLNQYTDISQLSWMLGGLFLVADCAVSSGFIIVQVKVIQYYEERNKEMNFRWKISRAYWRRNH